MWKICGYHIGKVYKEYAECLKKSLKELNLSFNVVPRDEQGDWYKNTQFKPTFLKQMLEKYPGVNIIYVDVDAIFCKYPAYFDKLDAEPEVNIAVHMLDHSKRRRQNHPAEMLSGTIYLKNTKETKQILDEWIELCKKGGTLWDQRALAEVLEHHKYHLLPETYTTIFDYMSDVKDPVIKHFQASRVERRKIAIKSQQKIKSNPRKIVKNNSVIQIKRVNPR